ncbi:Carbohydrate binding domain-containing protein [Lachnospiraceae bacterium C10]|nr:Carbohydrate binding domain-containing protein [Lachnospiraceae bacterium C10]
MHNKKRLLTGVLAAATAVTMLSPGVDVFSVVKDQNMVIAEAKSKEPSKTLSKKGYTLKWKEDFNGNKLNRKDWNVELHEPGWVNQEQQEYVDSTENIQVKDGKLTIVPVKKVDENGNVSYTSGRVTTMGKHDFQYGIFEARLKVPKSYGYLPAFWMMPTDEQLYGQWPTCGEIDIMEVLGGSPTRNYGTLHFGEPHKQDQGFIDLAKGNFADEFHTFDVEWLPDRINWYCDGKLYHTVTDWYSAKEGQGENTFPAPFDQKYYMILNLAVGNSWAGMVDERTDFNDRFVIDYVKAYQKKSYDTKGIKKPAGEHTDATPVDGKNLVGDVTSDAWKFDTQQGGEATKEVKDGAITIHTKKNGTVDYAVQLLQKPVQIDKAGNYTLSFDASASEARQMYSEVSSPNNGWARYPAGNVVELTKEKKHYSFTFDMTGETDKECQVEFNLGQQSGFNEGENANADVTISNVKLVKNSQGSVKEDKTVRANGNCVYNGTFQEGEGRLGYWNVKKSKGAKVSVTNSSPYKRQLKVVVRGKQKVTLSQGGLPIKENCKYNVSFKVKSSAKKAPAVTLAGKSLKVKAASSKKLTTVKTTLVTPKSLKAKDQKITLTFNKPGTYYIDDVMVSRVMTGANMLENGDFKDGISKWSQYVDASASGDIKAENGKVIVKVDNAGTADWNVQLKQGGLALKAGKTYKISFKASSTVARKMKLAIMRDKGDYKWFGGINADLTDKEQTFTATFTPEADDNDTIVCQLSMGKYGDTDTPASTITISDVTLVEQ